MTGKVIMLQAVPDDPNSLRVTVMFTDGQVLNFVSPKANYTINQDVTVTVA